MRSRECMDGNKDVDNELCAAGGTVGNQTIDCSTFSCPGLLVFFFAKLQMCHRQVNVKMTCSLVSMDMQQI